MWSRPRAPLPQNLGHSHWTLGKKAKSRSWQVRAPALVFRCLSQRASALVLAEELSASVLTTPHLNAPHLTTPHRATHPWLSSHAVYSLTETCPGGLVISSLEPKLSFLIIRSTYHWKRVTSEQNNNLIKRKVRSLAMEN